MSTLRTTTLKHGSSTVDNLVFDNQGRSTFGNDALFVNAQNGRIGINTLTPAVALDVNGAINSTGNTTLNGTLSLTGNLAVDTSTFVVDTVNDRVGIGTASPQAKLQIGGTSTEGVPSLFLSSAPNVSNTSDIALSANAVIRSENSIRNVVNDGGVFQWWIGGTDNKAGVAGATEIMRITPSGNVGIRTEDPQQRLEVGGSNATIRINNSDSGANVYGEISNTNLVAGALTFTARGGANSFGGYTFNSTDGTNTEPLVTIRETGNVGIGVTNPVSNLQVVDGDGDASISIVAGTTTSDSELEFGDPDDRNAGLIKYANSDDSLSFRTSGSGEDMRIDSAGRLLVGTTEQSASTNTTWTKLEVKNSNLPSAIDIVRDDDSITTGNSIGELRFWSNDGGVYDEIATIQAAADGNYSTGDKPGRLIFSTTAAGATSPTERMRIDSNGSIILSPESGNFLINVRNPSSSPSIVLNRPQIPNTATGTSIAFDTIGIRYADNTTANELIHYRARPATSLGTSVTVGDQYGFYVDDALNNATNNYGFFSNIAENTGRWNFYANGTAANYFAGNILFQSTGFTSITNGSVNAKSVVSSGIINSSRDATSNLTHYQFYNPNGLVGSITTNGSATAYNESSDYRLKENVIDLTGAIDRVKQLQVRRFNFIADPNTTVDGFLAHEAQAVVPESVTGNKDEVDAEGNPVYQGIDKSKLVPLLTAALQEALTKIESLESRLAALENS